MNYKRESDIESIRIDYINYCKTFFSDQVVNIDKIILDITDSLNGRKSYLVYIKSINGDLTLINTNKIEQVHIKHKNNTEVLL